ncbi:hypothetical protein N7528_006347 [Penicillium herquei]|nr:hypothetical protein N7528_006347 [Penicillium herquei]
MPSTTSARKPSTSCANCRAVKRRCDKKEPHCGQCVRMGQECHGYRDQWELVFRDQTKQTIQRSKSKKDMNPSQNMHSSRVSQYHGERQRPLPSQESTLVQGVASGSAISLQLFSSFLEDYFPREAKPDFLLDPSYSILSGIHTLPHKGQMLQTASSALSCIFLGKIHKDKALLKYGIRLYSQGIYEMSKAISRKAYNADLVYTCTLFGQIGVSIISLYNENQTLTETQAHYCPDSLNQPFLHIDGLIAISKLYHAREDESPLIGTIYGQLQKFRLALSGFMYLSEPMIQLLKEPGEGLMYESIQLLTDLSILAAAVNNPHLSRDPQVRKSLLEDCLALERRNLEFYAQMSGRDADTEPTTYEYAGITTKIPPTEDLFGPAYEFSSVGKANMHIFIWSSCSLVYPLVHHAYVLAETETIPDILRAKGESPRQVANRLSVSYISKAVRCMPYCTQEGMNPWAIYYGMFSVIIASRVFSHNQDRDRFNWTLEMMQYMDQSGFELAARLYDMCQRYWDDPRGDDFYMLPYCR